MTGSGGLDPHTVSGAEVGDIMFTIGDFARHGRVSVRMLRHYDATGLLRPAHVDPATGYRYYAAAQLARLNRVIALKELGFTLQQVREILDEKVTTEELRGMLRLRRAELESAMAAAAARLVQVEARLRSIESEGHMPSDDVVIKSIPAVRVAELTAIAAELRARGHQPGDRAAVRRAVPAPGRGRVRRGPAWPTTRTRRRAADGSSSTPLCRSRRRSRTAPAGRRPAARRAGGDHRAPGVDGRRGADRADAGRLDRRERVPLGRLRP